MLKTKRFVFRAVAPLMAAAIVSTGLMAQETQEQQKNLDRIDESEKLSVVWVNPKEFTDIRPGLEGRERFRSRTMEDLYEYMDELAADLPDGHKLKMNVMDVDLAGRVWPGTFIGFNNPNDVRLIRQVDIPRMHISYELLDESGAVLKTGEKKLKDMAFQDRLLNIRRNDNLVYEKHMVKRWFKREFREELAANQSL